MPEKVKGTGVTYAASRAITAAYYPDAIDDPDGKSPPVYTELQGQGATPPYFHVTTEKTENVKEPNARSVRKTRLKVRYCPALDEKRKYEKCAEIGNELLLVLDSISGTDGGKFAAESKEYEIVSNNLIFRAVYNVRAAKIENAPQMETVEINKEGETT